MKKLAKKPNVKENEPEKRESIKEKSSKTVWNKELDEKLKESYVSLTKEELKEKFKPIEFEEIRERAFKLLYGA